MEFLNNDFLLTNDTAKRLYHYAEALPIVDYHCHLQPLQIASNTAFTTVTQLWLYGDHYKWRLMRACGVNERFITGNADDAEKFAAFATILPRCIGNPIYVWCHLELKRFFGYTGTLCAETAQTAYGFCNQKIAEGGFTTQNLIQNAHVTALCTTDDPIDTLEHHQVLAQSQSFPVRVLPTFRPDAAVHIERERFTAYLQSLSDVCDMDICDIDTLTTALDNRLAYFIQNGCRITDHALDAFVFAPCTHGEANTILKKVLSDAKPTPHETEQFQTYVLLFLAARYAKEGLTMQLHFNCLRNVNTQGFAQLGADTGYDCINISADINKLTLFLDTLTRQNSLPNTIVYSLNPNDNAAINTVLGCFQSAPSGKMQSGSAWWFNDTKSGMRAQLTALAENGVLGNFVGMLTDSRSFLSYARHEYFRRILCEWIAEQVNSGEYPDDDTFLKPLLRDICYNNAARLVNMPTLNA